MTNKNAPYPYIELMRNFTKAHEDKCNTLLSYNTKKDFCPAKQMPNGSVYEGKCDLLGMNGIGKYTFPNGVIYEGEFEDGLFHGTGDLIYPDGTTLMCRFRRGKVVERTVQFNNGLFYSDRDWEYCMKPDRRFWIEHKEEIQPGGNSYMIAEEPAREIPEGHYDTGDGFYNPKTKVVYTEDLTTIIRSLSVREQKWTEDNCRVGRIEPGPRHELYEEWLEPNELRPESTHMIDTFGLSTNEFSEYQWFRYPDDQKSSNMWLSAGHQYSSHMFLGFD